MVVLRVLLIQGAVWALLYVAFFMGNVGAMHLLKFYVWAIAIVAPLTLFEPIIKSYAKQKRYPALSAMNQIQWWVVLGFFVWHGHVATGVACLGVLICGAVYRYRVKQLCGTAESACTSNASAP